MANYTFDVQKEIMTEAELNSDFNLPETLTEIEECDNTQSSTEFSSSDASVPESDEYNRTLQNRIISLQETIHILKNQLQEEREIWKRELEEKKDYDYCMAQSLLPSYKFPNIEHDYQRFQDNFMQSHYENRQIIQKQIEFANYKRRLLEVENMCNLELLRVKQSVQILQPLQMIASEWKFDNESGDGLKNRFDSTEEKESSLEQNKLSKIKIPPSEPLELNMKVDKEKTTSQPNVNLNNS